MKQILGWLSGGVTGYLAVYLVQHRLLAAFLCRQKQKVIFRMKKPPRQEYTDDRREKQAALSCISLPASTAFLKPTAELGKLMSGGMKFMEFGDQIKAVRKTQNLTQEQFAQQLNVTRQAVSNWENNRNLPDIEMLIQISREFHVSLDQLILGGNSRNNMTEKLIQDGSETRRAKMNLISAIIGGGLMLIGLVCLIVKPLTVEYVDETGLLHENFFLLPIGFLFLFAGIIVILAAGIRLAWQKKHPAAD